MFCTSCYGAYAAVFMENAFTAGYAFFCPGGPFLKNADELRIKAGINRFVISLGNRLHPCTAAKRKDDIISVDRLGRLFYKDVIALPLNRELFNFKREVLQPRSYAQRRRVDADFAFTPGQAYRNARTAP